MSPAVSVDSRELWSSTSYLESGPRPATLVALQRGPCFDTVALSQGHTPDLGPSSDPEPWYPEQEASADSDSQLFAGSPSFQSPLPQPSYLIFYPAIIVRLRQAWPLFIASRGWHSSLRCHDALIFTGIVLFFRFASRCRACALTLLSFFPSHFPL